MLAAGALVASLLAVGASPAVALDEDSKPDKPAATSACVGDATDDQMFSDVSEGHAFRGAIDCLAYYGVTVGYGDGTFRPNADVSNEEMVLFMERAAAAAGADAEAVVGDFADTGSDPVNRGDMALLISRLLVAATSAESGGTPANASTFPVARRTDSSGTVRIGYTYTGGASVETITANTSVTAGGSETLTPIQADGTNVTKAVYWAAPAAGPGVASGTVLAADLDNNTIIVSGSDGPQSVNYDDNDQYAVGASGEEALTSMAAFEEALTADGKRTAGPNDTVVVSSYDPNDSGDVARFVLTVVAN